MTQAQDTPARQAGISADAAFAAFALGTLALAAAITAEELSISDNTVRKRIAQIYAKCGVHSKQELLTLVQGADGDR